jgi:peptidoglycan/LPS O-acetylase OafA/YrhL
VTVAATGRSAPPVWHRLSGMSASSVSPPALPLPLRVAVAVLAVQAVALGALALFVIYSDLTGDDSQVSIAVGVTAFVLGYGLALGVIARKLAARRGGARGPAVALQLLLLAPAYFMITGGLPVPGVILLVAVVTVVAALMTPSAARALGIPATDRRGDQS